MNNQKNSFFPQYSTSMQASRATTTPVTSHTPKDCATLFDVINKASFAMDDTRLFLDTHPNCAEALEYYKKMAHVRKEAIKEYELHYGPIVSYHAVGDCNDGWLWNMGPLPWENACCNGRRV